MESHLQSSIERTIVANGKSNREILIDRPSRIDSASRIAGSISLEEMLRRTPPRASKTPLPFKGVALFIAAPPRSRGSRSILTTGGKG